MSSSNTEGELMADPYAGGAAGSASSAASSVGSSLGLPSFGAMTGSSSASEGSYGGGDFHIPAAPAPIPQPDFLFETDYDEKFRRSWGERLTYHVGVAYLAGLTGGGVSGIAQGLRETAGERQRIRINGVLNKLGQNGPKLGNSFGCVGERRRQAHGVCFVLSLCFTDTARLSRLSSFLFRSLLQR